MSRECVLMKASGMKSGSVAWGDSRGCGVPEISVCMASHNGEEYIHDQVQSILTQLNPDDELIIVDDASTDGTMKVLSKISDPRVHVLANQENLGYVRTFERSMRAARGKIIFLSDQDDVWMRGRVKTMIEALDDKLMVVSNCKHVGGQPGFFQSIRLRERDSKRHIRNIMGILVGYRLHWGCAMAMRRELLQIALPFPRGMSESHDQYLAMAANLLHSIVYLQDDTVWHRIHRRNVTPSAPRSIRKIATARLFFLWDLLILEQRRVVLKAKAVSRKRGDR